MPRKDKATYQEYMRDYMRAKRQGLTGINNDLNVGARGLEPPTSASRTLRATKLRHAPQLPLYPRIARLARKFIGLPHIYCYLVNREILCCDN